MSDSTKLEFANDGEVLKYLESQGNYIIRTKEEDQTYWNNTVKKEVDAKVSEIYGSFESSIHDITGIDKNPNEKASDFLGRAFGQIIDGHKATQGDLQKKLDAKLKESDAAAEVTKQFETFKAQAKAQAKEYEEKIKGMETAAFRGRVGQIATDAAEQIKNILNKDLDPYLVSSTVNNLLSEFERETIAKDVNGVIIFNDKDDKPIMSEKDGKMLSAYEIMLGKVPDNLKDMPRVIGGAGSGGDGSGTNGQSSQQNGANKFDIDLPEDVQNVSQLVDHIKKAFPNVDKNSKEFNEYYRANKGKVKYEV